MEGNRLEMNALLQFHHIGITPGQRPAEELLQVQLSNNQKEFLQVLTKITRDLDDLYHMTCSKIEVLTREKKMLQQMLKKSE